MEPELGPNMVRVSTGVVFSIKKPPVMAFEALKQKMEKNRPKVPQVYIEAKGRHQENPADPDYIEAVKQWNQATMLALYDAAILLCTETIQVPEGITKVDEESWLEDLRLLGIAPVSTGKKERYLAWVKFYGAPTDEDFMALYLAVIRRAGVAEGDVAAALAAYKSGTGGETDRGVPATGCGGDGNNLR